MRDLTNGRDRIDVDGANVRQIVTALEALYPGIRARLVDGETISPRVAVAVDGYVTRLGFLERVGPTSEVHFLPAISGGNE